MRTSQAFDGTFDILPIRSQLDSAAVPFGPTGDDFAVAVSQLRAAEAEACERFAGTVTWRVAAACWRVEAIRERRTAGPGAPINTAAVYVRTGAALVEWARG